MCGKKKNAMIVIHTFKMVILCLNWKKAVQILAREWVMLG